MEGGVTIGELEDDFHIVVSDTADQDEMQSMPFNAR
ncbi:MAG: hypothetical protein ACI90V_006634 [Bacillariaceae sp.]|jgi:hypothetical protein